MAVDDVTVVGPLHFPDGSPASDVWVQIVPVGPVGGLLRDDRAGLVGAVQIRTDEDGKFSTALRDNDIIDAETGITGTSYRLTVGKRATVDAAEPTWVFRLDVSDRGKTVKVADRAHTGVVDPPPEWEPIEGDSWVPDPSGEPDGRVPTTEGGELVYKPGGGGPGGGVSSVSGGDGITVTGTASDPIVAVDSSVVRDDDPALTNDRDPTAHAASHAHDGTDPIEPGDIGAAAADAATGDPDQVLHGDSTWARLDAGNVDITAGGQTVSMDFVVEYLVEAQETIGKVTNPEGYDNADPGDVLSRGPTSDDFGVWKPLAPVAWSGDYRDLTDRPPALPDPASGDPGDIPSVTPAGDGYELVPPPTGGGGGIGPAPWPLNTSGTTWIAPWGELNTGDRMRVTDRIHYVLLPVPRRVTVTRMAWRITPPDTNDGTLVLRFYDVAAAGGPGEPIGTEYVMSTHDDKSVGSATVTLDPGYVYIALQAVGYSGSQPEVPTPKVNGSPVIGAQYDSHFQAGIRSSATADGSWPTDPQITTGGTGVAPFAPTLEVRPA